MEGNRETGSDGEGSEWKEKGVTSGWKVLKGMMKNWKSKRKA